ncbi:SUMF1/EgtB/PvdO family nonheme iron enzyme [Gaoshiqia sediminis]|uniref:SUMF1/EgtB/PvdO family nonheme iron enzyme n=1 Tax=Gaoshiqia sediminis TaxID=2986998 RepID=A0AA41Y462_9BACT|nr:SUMF1/EgtB/PvdO family nonheme iron enzyme [Gaoshiqia sediminis]MCW0483141.1 SUMF1/EgtB/PvdO family nonheme iron enzyme [Gaoshiqia sediminis]
MKKPVTILVLASLIAFISCQRNELLQYVDDKPLKPFYEPSPFGMSYINRGSFVIGPDDEIQDEATPLKRVSIESFWMDDTEITNNEYRQFVYWVRDSIARTILSESFPEFMLTEDGRGNPYDQPRLNWEDPIEWHNPDFQSALEELYLPADDRVFFPKSIDSRKLIFDYHWIDYQQAAKRSNSYNFETQSYQGTVTGLRGEEIPIKDRSAFIMRESTPVYPDTLCWVRDYTYSYNDPKTEKYFWHVAFDDYPVVGVTWKQAVAFCHWRTKLYNEYQLRLGEVDVHNYRLPTEAEWEYAARGGEERTLYPWGNYYIRNQMGCFIANFKPNRGNYVADSRSATTTMKVGSYDPNNKKLYDMAGNVAEWTSTAFYESAYELMSDFNPTFEYNAFPQDPPTMKRKVIRGGSWKDIAYFLRNGTRSFEYQDSAKSYIGFRCVKTSFADEFKQ